VAGRSITKDAAIAPIRIQQLDVVRGLAALSVALTHTTQHLTATFIASAAEFFASLFQYTLWANSGLHPGIIVFIVLSGFCIHLPVARDGELPSKPGFWTVYWKRRVIRIVPVFLLGCALGALAAMPYGAKELADTGRAVAFYAFFPIGQIPGNGILGTVIVEMWLYVFYPVTLFIHRRYGAAKLLSIAFVIYLIPPLLVVNGVISVWAESSWFAFYLYWTSGMLSAEAAYNSKRNIPMWLVCSAFLAYVAVGNLVQIKGAHFAISLFFALWVGALLFVLVKRHYHPWKFWVRLGEVSYTLYVVHWPAILLWVSFVGLSTILGQLGFLAFLSATTIVLYLLVERPSHRFAKSFRL
jgi:peptidoglycan/LPS O-acetylase OafA/YrhL